MIFDVAALQM